MAIPDSFFAASLLSEHGVTLPAAGQYAVGQIFFPQNARQREQCHRIMENVAQQLGYETLTWRVVPTDNTDLGQSALNTEPITEQWFITAEGKLDKLETEQQVQCLPKSLWARLAHLNCTAAAIHRCCFVTGWCLFMVTRLPYHAFIPPPQSYLLL